MKYIVISYNDNKLTQQAEVDLLAALISEFDARCIVARLEGTGISAEAVLRAPDLIEENARQAALLEAAAALRVQFQTRIEELERGGS